MTCPCSKQHVRISETPKVLALDNSPRFWMALCRRGSCMSCLASLDHPVEIGFLFPWNITMLLIGKPSINAPFPMDIFFYMIYTYTYIYIDIDIINEHLHFFSFDFPLLCLITGEIDHKVEDHYVLVGKWGFPWWMMTLQKFSINSGFIVMVAAHLPTGMRVQERTETGHQWVLWATD